MQINSSLTQQLASNPQNSAWVFASAGSGKTKVLTDRVLRLLLENVSPNKILCLTFTKVAAAEMQQRINTELAKWVLLDDEELRKKLFDLSGKNPCENELKKARTLFVKILDDESKIKVQTIHAFCQSLIKIFPFEARVAPNFELLEDAKEELLLKQAQKEVLKKAQENEFLRNLVIKINSQINEESLTKLVSDLLKRKEKLRLLKENYFGIAAVVAEIFAIFGISPNEKEEEIIQKFISQIDLKEIEELASNLEKSGSSLNEESAVKIKEFLKNPQARNFNIYKSAFIVDAGTPRKFYKEISQDPQFIALAEKQRELIWQFCDQLNSLKIANNSALLLHFTDTILENYSQLKKKNSYLDYDDIIFETNRLLANPDFSNWIKMKMDGSFDHILIDESQDTNHLQWNIIKALSEDFFSGISASTKNRSIFIVGDEKQSIYSFQGAEPNISADIFEFFEKKLAGKLKKIELNNSFRSAPEILHAVDAVFANEERKKAISKVSEFKSHQPIRTSKGLVEIWPLIAIEKAKEEKNYEWQIGATLDEEQKDKEILAEIIASKIRNWIDNKRFIEGQKREIAYGDIMILLRKRNNGFAELIQAFHKYKIPFNSISKISFSQNLLIQDLLAAAKFALLPIDDLNLACLLKSPLFRISEEELLEICLMKNQLGSNIYEVLQDEEIKSSLAEIIEKSKNSNAFEFFYFLLHEKNHQKNFLAHFGHESLELLDKFTLMLHDFCENFSPNLQKFLEFVEKTDPQISLLGAENNCVKITTIHSAKGLQAPVVIIPDAACDPNSGPRQEIFWLGNMPVWCSRKADENEVLKMHKEVKARELYEEYLRLLYVAMTRPQDELYIGGFGTSKPQYWYEIVKNSLPNNILAKEKFVKEEVKIPQNNEILLELETIRKPSSSLTVSTIAPELSISFIKGRLIHKILEIFGKNFREEKSWLLNLAQKIIAKEEFLNAEQKNEISNLSANFLSSQQFSEIFCGEVKCEFEVIVDGNSKRFDLLVEKENEILIIDYKSDESLPSKAPQQYINQIAAYKKIAQKIYPTKKISGAILWVKFLQLENL